MDTQNDIHERKYMEDRLLRIEDIAFYLNTSKSYAYRLIQTGALRSVKIGRCIRVIPSDLQIYVQQNYTGFVKDT